MSKPKFTPYVDSLTGPMKLCMDRSIKQFSSVNKLYTMVIQCQKQLRDYQKKE